MSIFGSWKKEKPMSADEPLPWDRLVRVAHALMEQGLTREQIMARVGPANAACLESRLPYAGAVAPACGEQYDYFADPLNLYPYDVTTGHYSVHPFGDGYGDQT